MSMQKVRILRQSGGNWQIVVDCAAQFNPEKLQLNKKASWRTEKTWKSNIGNTTFTGGDPISLSATLFFDTTATGGDVRTYTDALMSLTMVDPAEAAQLASEKEVKEMLEEANKELSDYEETIQSLEDAGATIFPFQQEHLDSLKQRVEDLENQTKGLAAGS